jgi:hypothetical protein
LGIDDLGVSMDVPERVRNVWPSRRKESWYERAGHEVGKARNLAIVAGVLAVVGGAWGAQRRLTHG